VATAGVSLRTLAAAIWRQVARDLTSRSPEMRVTARAWLLSEAAVTWATYFDPAIDEPEIVIQAVLIGGRSVRATRFLSQRTPGELEPLEIPGDCDTVLTVVS
jgi:hypothetical protein